MRKWILITGVGLFGLGLFIICMRYFYHQNDSLVEADEPSVRVDSVKNHETLTGIESDISPKESVPVYPEDIGMEISRLERNISLDRTIERLNANAVSDEERAEIGISLQKLDQLRIKEIEQDILTLEQDIKILENAHISRLEQFGVKKS